ARALAVAHAPGAPRAHRRLLRKSAAPNPTYPASASLRAIVSTTTRYAARICDPMQHAVTPCARRSWRFHPTGQQRELHRLPRLFDFHLVTGEYQVAQSLTLLKARHVGEHGRQTASFSTDHQTAA